MKYNSIKNWKSVCNKIGHDPNVLPDVSNLSKEDQINIIENFKVVKLAKAINMIDKENGIIGTPVYMPYFNKTPFSFRHTNCVGWNVAYCNASVGLLFATRAGAEYAGKKFLSTYKKLILG